MSEAQIQKTILDYLAYQKDIYFFRAGSGAIKTDTGRYFKSGKKGCPDIIVCKDGRFIGLEVKTDKGRLSESQIIAGEEILNAGGIYKVVKSLEEVNKILYE